MTAFLVAAWLGISSAFWAGRLILGPAPLSTGAGILVGLDLLVAGLVAATGLVMTHGRWARRLGLGVLAAQAVTAAVLDYTTSSAVGLTVTAIGIVLWAGPFLRGWVRRLPPADAVPPGAIMLALLLLGVPGVAGLAAPGGPGPAHWVLAGTGLLTAWAYARALHTGLWAARLLVPAAAVVAAVTSSPAGGAVLIVLGVAVAGLSWHRDARQAVVDLLPRPAAGVAVPARLVPSELLNAAGYDEDGRPRRRL